MVPAGNVVEDVAACVGSSSKYNSVIALLALDGVYPKSLAADTTLFLLTAVLINASLAIMLSQNAFKCELYDNVSNKIEIVEPSKL